MALSKRFRAETVRLPLVSQSRRFRFLYASLEPWRFSDRGRQGRLPAFGCPSWNTMRFSCLGLDSSLVDAVWSTKLQRSPALGGRLRITGMPEERRRGHSIEIIAPGQSTPGLEAALPEDLAAGVDAGDEEVLLIDGKVVPYRRTTEGVRIYYQPPANSLIEAARGFVDTQPEKPE